jgi:hypothetical protein
VKDKHVEMKRVVFSVDLALRTDWPLHAAFVWTDVGEKNRGIHSDPR